MKHMNFLFFDLWNFMYTGFAILIKPSAAQLLKKYKMAAMIGFFIHNTFPNY